MTLLTATIRLARELRVEYDRKQETSGLASWPTATILPLSAWLENTWKNWLYSNRETTSNRLLWPAEERVIWEDIIRSKAGNQLLDIPMTADAALKSWELLCHWQLPLDTVEWQDSPDCEAFLDWAEVFRDRCCEHNWFSNAELPEVVAGLIERGAVSVPDVIELAGFFELPPAQQRLFEALSHRGVEVREHEVPREAGDAVCLGVADASREIRAAAEWARRILEEEPDAVGSGFQIGIVVPDLDQRRSEVERIFGTVFHPRTRLRPDLDPKRLFNISLGLPAREYPMIQTALLLLGTNPRDMPYETASHILRSPFLHGAEEEMTARALLDAVLRSMGEPRVTLMDIIGLAGKDNTPHQSPMLVSRLEAWNERQGDLAASRMPSDWSPVLSSLLREISWPGGRALDSIEYQTLEVWNELLSQLARLDGACGRVTFESAVAMIGRFAAGRLFQPESLPAPVQILGVLETSGLRFDRLWLTGMHDGAWPAAHSADPFLPLRLQRRHNLPDSSPARGLESTSTRTSHLLASAPAVVVSYPRRDGDSDLRVSPLFGSLPETSGDDLGLPAAASHLERLPGSSSMETLEDATGPPCDDGAHSGGTFLFKLQAACPFKAFAELRLGASAPQEPEPGLNALDRGILVHRILERVWQQLRSHKGLLSLTGNRLAEVVRACVRTELRTRPNRRILTNPRFEEVEQARLEGIIGAWLEKERSRKPFTVQEREERRKITVGGLTVGIRADRVDRLENGDIVIIDYKTGECGTANWEGDRPDEPQLPIYAATADAPVAGVIFARLMAGSIGVRGLTSTGDVFPGAKEPPGTMDQTIEAWNEVLDRLGRDFKAGRAEVDPKDRNQTCRYCALPSLCRINQGTVDLECGDA